jgi:hypothetical protein
MESYPALAAIFAYDYANARPLPLALNSPGGNVGIGTTTPRSPLDVVGNWDGEFGAVNIAGRYPTLRFTGDAQTANESWIIHMGSLRPGNLEFYRRSGAQPWVNSLTLDLNGNIGIGTSTPQSRLEIAGQDAVRAVGFQPFITLVDSGAGNARSAIQCVGGDVFLESESFINASNPNAYAKLNSQLRSPYVAEQISRSRSRWTRQLRKVRSSLSTKIRRAV